MVRSASVKDDNDGGSSSAHSEPKTSKRRCVQSACVPCRKRKSKCDGGTPKCATCTAVYKTPCHYDEQSENRRGKVATAAPKRDSTSIAEPSDNAEFLLNSIRSLPDTEAYELIQHIRKDPHLDISGLAESWKKTVTLPIHPPSEHASLERDLSLLIGKPSITQTGESHHFGHTSSLGLVPEDENYWRARMRLAQPLDEHRNGTWTNLTDDIGFVERLLDLYFRWSHPFYVIFSRECFYKDFHSGRQKYCSPLLVNAILSYACHFTDEPAGRTDPDNFRTAGDHFFAEARRLLFEDETPSLLTTQALCVMSMREPSAGRDSSGFMYIGRCMRMAVELGLHLNNTSPALGLTPSEVEVRKVTFWGCFTVETVWSLSVGRISQLPRASITLDKPILEEAYFAQLPQGTFITSRVFLQEFSTLSELINDNNYMYFAPKERFTSRRLLDQYNKYQTWYNNLPLTLCLPPEGVQPPPHLVVLHMLYYTVLVHLFRPMLKVDLIHSDLRPRDICIDSANKVTDLLRLYRTFYDMRACQLVFTHILLSVSIVHLLYSPDNTLCASNLVESLQGLEDLSICHYFGARSFKIVHALAQTWNIPWPEALNLSKLLPKQDPALSSPALQNLFNIRSTSSAAQDLRENNAQNATNTNYNPTLPRPSTSLRRESLSMFSPEDRDPPYPSRPTIQGIAGPGIDPHSTIPYTAPSSASDPHANVPPTTLGPPQPHLQQPNQQHQTAPVIDSAEQLFWTPMPGVGVPIIPRTYQMSPMDLNSVLGGADEWDRFGRDGFKISETWAPDLSIFGHASNAVGPAGPAGPEAYAAAAHPGLAGHGGGPQQQDYGTVSGSGNGGSGYEWWGGAPGTTSGAGNPNSGGGGNVV